MERSVEMWRGIRPEVREDQPGHRYRVVFQTSGLMQPVGPDGEYPSVPEDARVIVAVDDDQAFEVVRYDPPEIPFPNLSQADLEQRAIEEVRKHIGPG
jgi:hypothetical protein